jgi:hypothetical protein
MTSQVTITRNPAKTIDTLRLGADGHIVGVGDTADCA